MLVHTSWASPVLIPGWHSQRYASWCCVTGDHVAVWLAAATLPAPAILHANAAATFESLTTLRCTVHVANGRLDIVTIAAAAHTLHFSTSYVHVTMPMSDDNNQQASLTAAPAQPRSLPDPDQPCPAVPRHSLPAVFGDVAAPACGSDGYRLHPAVLDGCFQLGAAKSADGELQQVRVPRMLPATASCVARHTGVKQSFAQVTSPLTWLCGS